jgi:class 3 adenylate cyclase
MGSDSRKVSLAHRFGEKRVDCLLKLLDRDSTALSAKPVDDVIVLHVDIRGSRQLEARLAEVRQQDKYADFIREYHEMARQKIIEFGGVFDKTMGDGIQAIFNVFRISAVSVEPFDSLEVTKCSAVKCAVAIFDLFSELVDRFRRRVFHAAPPQGFCLGAGLTIGRGYLGSFSSPPSVPGFEFSIHGEAGNRAGTLVGLARGQNLANGIRSAHQQDKLNVLRVFPGSETSRAELANDEVERLTRFIEEGVRSLLLMAPDFESARLPDNLEYYMFAADGAAMSILTWSKAAGTLDLGKPVP